MAASKIPFKKVCEWCGQEFYAKKVTARYCCKKCNEHAYKAKLRHTQIQLVAQEYKETVLDKPIKYLQEKLYLTVKETATVLGLTRMTVYNLIYSGMLTAARISSRLTLIKREDIDSMLSSNPYSKRQKPKDEPITEFYTTTEIKEKFGVSNSWIFKVGKEKNIPKIFRMGNTYWSKSHIEKAIAALQPDESINEWYSAADMQQKFNKSKEQDHSDDKTMSKAFKPVVVPKKTDIMQDTPAEILFPSNQDRDPKYQTEPSIEDKLNRIIEEEQTKTRYDTAMEDLNSVIKQLDLSRDVLLSSCRTFDDIRPTFLYFIDKATAAIDELQKFKDYFENIESLTYNAKLDQSSVDILLKYNEFVANSEKERLSKYLEEVGSTLDEHYDKFKRKIRDSEGVWLSRKVFWWAVVIIYGLLVISFLLGCFWCIRRFG